MTARRARRLTALVGPPSCLAFLLWADACSGADKGAAEPAAGAPTEPAAGDEGARRATERAEIGRLRRAEDEARRRAAEAAQAAREKAEEEARRQALAEAERQREIAERAERERLEAERRAFEQAYPLHGVAYHFLARVYERPTTDAEIVGYMRRGSRFRASERVPGSHCARGWHEVPGGGFVCRAEGYKVGGDPQFFEHAPQPPAVEDALPYAYAYTPRYAVPQFWRVPSVEEEAEVRSLFERLKSIEEAEAEETDSPDPAHAEDAVADAEPEPSTGEARETGEATEAVEAPPPPGTEDSEESEDPLAEAEDRALAESSEDPAEGEASAKRESESAVSASPERAGDEADAESDAPPLGPESLEVPDFVRQRMRRGFYVSVDGREREAGREYVRTVRGGYVRAEALIPNEPPTNRGVILGGAWNLPVAFVYRDGSRRLRRNPADGRFSNAGRFERHTPLVVVETIERTNARYHLTEEGFAIRETSARIAHLRERPSAIGEDERWIHVDLGEQALVAYEGDRPVFATTVSTGREGFETPTGLFRIESKHVSTTMDDLNSEDAPYSIEDVPWTMYFEGNFALHGAFWHDHFGRVRSHGCVNLSPADARWIFQWTDPVLPASWHGVFARADRRGTAILIEE